MPFDQLYGGSNVSILIQTAEIVIKVKIHKKYLLWDLQLHDEQNGHVINVPRPCVQNHAKHCMHVV